MRSVITTIIILLMIPACYFDKTSKSIRRENRKFSGSPLLITANKDSIFRNLVLEEKSHFIYIEGPVVRSSRSARYYAGFYKRRMDTIFLEYYQDHIPPLYETYMILDLDNEQIALPLKGSAHKSYLKILSGSTNFR